MRSRKDLLGSLSLAANQRIGQERVCVQSAIALEPYADGEGFGQQDLRRHAVGVPRIPPARQPALQRFILAGARL